MMDLRLLSPRKSTWTPYLVGVLTLWSLCSAGAYGNERLKELNQRIGPLVRGHAGETSVYIRSLETGEVYGYRADQEMPTASLIKLAVMNEVYRQADSGKLDLEEKIAIRPADQVPGSGVLTKHFSAGVQLSIRDFVQLMIAYSDNTATNVLVEKVGLKRLNDELRRSGFESTAMHSLVYRGDTSIAPEESRKFGLGKTTAEETARLLASIHSRAERGDASAQIMLEHLRDCEDDSMINRLIPAGRFAHKTGALSAVRCDGGILETGSGPVVVVVLTSNNDDQRWSSDNQAEGMMSSIGQIVTSIFQDPTTGDQPRTLRRGATGRIVSDLQRTLNRHLPESERISVDGEFGPNTENAVKSFQQLKSLEPTGIVNDELWAALGPLQVKDSPVPSPSEVNRRQLPKLPSDLNRATPFVSCKGWALFDLESERRLAGFEDTKPLPMASTTKVMTALVVMRQAQDAPECLDESVTFSNSADETPGSTSQIRAGEQLTVRELLYGLLLPSGNDAATALAEHFGAKLPGEDESSTPYDRFIAEMNRLAGELGLDSAEFKNPHGLTEPSHQISASDLGRLAIAAWKYPLLREIASTREYGVTVKGVEGYSRNLLWRNTNRLLATEGYLGFKTGTTKAAGACLIAVGERDGRQIVSVVLGSSNSDARYLDTRNLLRFGFDLPSAE